MSIQNTRNISVSADPELLVLKGGIPHHVIDVLKGYGKEKPLPVFEGAIQPDNVAFEFNIDPCTDRNMFSKRILKVIQQGRKHMPAKEAYDFQCIASHSFQNINEFPAEAFVFGCEPDFDAFTGDVNPSPNAEDETLRSFGGHIHLDIPVEDITEEAQRSVVLACDCLLGLWSVIKDKDTRRKELYGKASAYRPKHYGAEYRTMSNFWVATPAMHKKAFDLAILAANITDFELLAALTRGLTSIEEVRFIINQNNVKAANRLFKLFEQKATKYHVTSEF